MTTPDQRTREQHMADVAAAALANANEILSLSRTFSAQVTILANRAIEAGAKLPDSLTMAIGAPVVWREIQTALRDVASTLPIRGLDFGADE